MHESTIIEEEKEEDRSEKKGKVKGFLKMVFLGGDKDKKDGKENKEEEEVKDKHEHE